MQNSQNNSQMTDLENMYQFAEENDIAVLDYKFSDFKAVAITDKDWHCTIGVDSSQMCSSAEELCVLAHEIGHCETGSFYNTASKFDHRGQRERRADRWAAERLCPKDEVIKAINSGEEEVWQLAEYFSVTIPFMLRALEIYHMR